MASSASGSSRLLVGFCCVTFISVLLLSVGFVHLELELTAHKERIVTLEQNQQILIPATDTSPLTKGKQNVDEIPFVKEMLSKGKSMMPKRSINLKSIPRFGSL